MELPQKNRQWYAQGLRFSCTQCGRCCSGPAGFVWFTPTEAQQIAEYLGIALSSFYEAYARKLRGRWSMQERDSVGGRDCVFLTRDSAGRAACSIYPVRPAQCRTWPFWPENLATPEDWKRAAKSCPGMDRSRFYPIEQIRVIRDSNP